MKNIRIYLSLLSFMLVSCGSQKEKPPGKAVTGNEQVKAKDEKIRVIWKQYKKISERNLKDTIPFANCYITIEGSTFTYIREGKELYTDSIYLDTQYKATRYNFKKHPADVLIFTNENELILKRDAYDGDHEFFRREI